MLIIVTSKYLPIPILFILFSTLYIDTVALLWRVFVFSKLKELMKSTSFSFLARPILVIVAGILLSVYYYRFAAF